MVWCVLIFYGGFIILLTRLPVNRFLLGDNVGLSSRDLRVKTPKRTGQGQTPLLTWFHRRWSSSVCRIKFRAFTDSDSMIDLIVLGIVAYPCSVLIAIAFKCLHCGSQCWSPSSLVRKPISQDPLSSWDSTLAPAIPGFPLDDPSTFTFTDPMGVSVGSSTSIILALLH